MSSRIKITLLLLSFLSNLYLFAQDTVRTKSWEFGGYLTSLMSSTFSEWDENWQMDEVLQNRLRFGWTPLSWLKLDLAVRQRLFILDTWRATPDFSEYSTGDLGYFNLSHDFTRKEALVWNLGCDRASVRLALKKAELTAGRQRINWGQTFAWNPNDIFNTYSLYDVDYPERPGSDALRLQYFTGPASSAEAAAKLDNSGRLTAAMLLKRNINGYDVQVISGVLDQEDFVAGAGWSGQIRNTGFRGELSWFIPLCNSGDSTDIFLISTGIDHVFPNSLAIQAELLYNKDADRALLTGDYVPAGIPATPKSLSFTEWNVYSNVSYPFTPLLNGSLASIWFPCNEGYYLLPSLEYSLDNNLDLSLMYQLFRARFEYELSGVTYSKYLKMNKLMLRFQWSF